jgi:hypothetical protein
MGQLLKIGNTFINISAITYVKIENPSLIYVNFVGGEPASFSDYQAKILMTALESMTSKP